MPDCSEPRLSNAPTPGRSVVAIRCEAEGYGIRFGLSEAEDQLLHGPVFATLPEALAWVDEYERSRAA